MTQEEFNVKLETLTYDMAGQYINEVGNGSKELKVKVGNCIRAALLIFQMSQNKDNIDNWEQYVAKYILGIEDVKKEN